MDGARYLEDGRLTVFRRNGTYYARLRLSPGKYVTRSLKTTIDKTLQWDMMLGKAIVKWAAGQGLRGNRSNITATFTPKKKRVRPAFEQWEFRQLWRTLCRRINTARDVRTRKSRELLQIYVLVV